ncbi:MAG: T9SS C-terminal target domain-containing protein, partial [Flavobacteriales bacterium]|nr:T9SS C-terminal target domain-containing protein [Flavobacteriales bacterium]
VLRGIGWVGSAMGIEGTELLATDVRIRLNVTKKYVPYVTYPGDLDPIIDPTQNNGLPLYTFGTAGFATENNVASTAKSALDLINVVPNPYYAFSGYETSRLDNRIKFINLPQSCTITIFNVSGTLVRKFKKDNSLTYLDWDLKNANNIPIAGGVYICHVEVPGVGEKVIKWFGALRPIDLQNF